MYSRFESDPWTSSPEGGCGWQLADTGELCSYQCAETIVLLFTTQCTRLWTVCSIKAKVLAKSSYFSVYCTVLRASSRWRVWTDVAKLWPDCHALTKLLVNRVKTMYQCSINMLYVGLLVTLF